MKKVSSKAVFSRCSEVNCVGRLFTVIQTRANPHWTLDPTQPAVYQSFLSNHGKVYCVVNVIIIFRFSITQKIHAHMRRSHESRNKLHSQIRRFVHQFLAPKIRPNPTSGLTQPGIDPTRGLTQTCPSLTSFCAVASHQQSTGSLVTR